MCVCVCVVFVFCCCGFFERLPLTQKAQRLANINNIIPNQRVFSHIRARVVACTQSDLILVLGHKLYNSQLLKYLHICSKQSLDFSANQEFMYYVLRTNLTTASTLKVE